MGWWYLEVDATSLFLLRLRLLRGGRDATLWAPHGAGMGERCSLRWRFEGSGRPRILVMGIRNVQGYKKFTAKKKLIFDMYKYNAAWLKLHNIRIENI